jgi:hypothetical protein
MLGSATQAFAATRILTVKGYLGEYETDNLPSRAFDFEFSYQYYTERVKVTEWDPSFPPWLFEIQDVSSTSVSGRLFGQVIPRYAGPAYLTSAYADPMEFYIAQERGAYPVLSATIGSHMTPLLKSTGRAYGPQLYVGYARLLMPGASDFGAVATIGDLAIRQPVPEPATWLLLLSGFAGVGVTIRRQRHRVRVSYS